jgi:hypothetical protein
MVAEGRFEPPTFGLRDLSHVSMGVGLYGCGGQGREGGLAFSIPRLGRTATIPPALVAGAGTNIGGGTYEHIPL